ncbi:MAG: GFA family protein [Pseudomonadota bacterium]|nr:GFA family protein [Pseudomonadota bacterium]
MCRKVHGAVFGTYAVVARGAFRLTAGSQEVRRFESSPGVFRFFCGSCGCQIYCEEERRPSITFYAPASLDAGCSPGHSRARERHIYVGSKACWYDIGDGLPQSEGA